jgi:hypothetical protein
MAASTLAALSLGGEPLSPMATTEEAHATPLLNLLEKLPDLFDAEVLRRLDPADRTFFAQVSHVCMEVVAASELPCAGTRVGMRQLNPADRARLAGEVRAFGHSRLGRVSRIRGVLRRASRGRSCAARVGGFLHLRRAAGFGQGERVPVGCVVECKPLIAENSTSMREKRHTLCGGVG